MFVNDNTGLIIYQTEDGETKIDVRLENETVWMTQKSISELYQTTPQNITLHIKSIYEEAELDELTTCKNYLQVQTEGKRQVQRDSHHYNLEMIISVGYRVRSIRGRQFRCWATKRLNEYLVKGFTIDDERLKEMRNIGDDYFDELLDRISDIRASEKRFYKKITDIYALAIDYDPKSVEAQTFFTTVENKFHFAIHGYTTIELIEQRADASKVNMGLTTMKGKKVRKSDVMVAKNYLSEKEMKSLNRIVNMYLDYAEDQAEIRNLMHMEDWQESLNAFLKFNEREILMDADGISHEVAKELAEKEYEKFNQKRLIVNGKDNLDMYLEEYEWIERDHKRREV